MICVLVFLTRLDPYESNFNWITEPRGCTLIFSHIRRLGLFFGFKILNFNIFWVFRKMKNEYFLGYEDFVDIFWGHHKIGLV